MIEEFHGVFNMILVSVFSVNGSILFMGLFIHGFDVVEIENERSKDNNIIVNSSPIKRTSFLRFIQTLEFENRDTEIKLEHNGHHVNDELKRDNVPEAVNVVAMSSHPKVSLKDGEDQEYDETDKVAEHQENGLVWF